MSQSERPLARIAQTVEETEAAMDAAAADGVVTPAEWRAVRLRVRRIGSRVARHDLEDAYGLAVARNGYHAERAVKLRRQLVALPPLSEDDELEPPAAIAA